MAHSYTPGLKVTRCTLLKRRRLLPIKGRVVVNRGDMVEPETVVACTELPGDVFPVNVANLIGVSPKDVAGAMLKQKGEAVEKGETLARSSSFFGLFKSEVAAPASGIIETVSGITGQVIIRGAALPVEVRAYIKGRVVDVFPEEGVEVETVATFIQGIFGVGGEVSGILHVTSESPGQILSEDLISSDQRGCIVVGGSVVTAGALRKAVECGVAAIVVGGIDDRDLRDFLGYDLGVAITGSEELGITLIVTEGFGTIDMAGKTFAYLKENEGRLVSVNGATQVRAGVIRPEIVIPIATAAEEICYSAEEPVLNEGNLVRCIRTPYFGRIGRVTALPHELQSMESGAVVRVLEVQFENGEQCILPRANIERIEEK